MAHITGSIRIEAPLEPSFNPAMTTVELLTPEPIGLGTKFRARMANAGMDMLVELIEFDRPRRLGSRTTSPMMETSGTLTCASETGATRLSWDWQVHPKGWFKALGPLVTVVGHRMERKIWTGLKRKLETTTAP